MSAFFSSIKTMVDNYSQGIVSIQGKLSRQHVNIITTQHNCSKININSQNVIYVIGLLANTDLISIEIHIEINANNLELSEIRNVIWR